MAQTFPWIPHLGGDSSDQPQTLETLGARISALSKPRERGYCLWPMMSDSIQAVLTHFGNVFSRLLRHSGITVMGPLRFSSQDSINSTDELIILVYSGSGQAMASVIDSVGYGIPAVSLEVVTSCPKKCGRTLEGLMNNFSVAMKTLIFAFVPDAN